MNTPVSFELAKLLKEKEFDRPCYHYYYNNKLDSSSKDNWNTLNGYSAPTISEVVMWLYENHNIWVVVNPHKGEDDLGKPFMEFDPEVWSFTNECVFHNTGLLYFNSPTEAYEAAIEYVLKNLI